MFFKFGIVLIATYATTASALPPCVCTREMKPVCGSNGQTYSNECMFKCAQATNPGLTLAKRGICGIPEACTCPFDYAPVCGTDGNTYGNECALIRKVATSPDLAVRHRGACRDEVNVVNPTCSCTREQKLVCGTDGITYDNLCLLNCATQFNSRLGLDHEGQCADKVRVVEQPQPVAQPVAQPSCACTRNLKPVCGSNGVTYSNECLMRCAGADLTVAKLGSCEA